jgi:hypothetical protein
MRRDADTRALFEDAPRVTVTCAFLGLCHMQVCAVADATDAEMLEQCNRENPAGTSRGWRYVYRTDDPLWGRTAPVVCQHDATRRHFLVRC